MFCILLLFSGVIVLGLISERYRTLHVNLTVEDMIAEEKSQAINFIFKID